MNALGDELRVGHIDYFNGACLGIPDDDIANSAVLAAIHDLRDGSDSTAVADLRDYRPGTPGEYQTGASLSDSPDFPNAKLLVLLGSIYGQLPETLDVFSPKAGLQLSLTGRRLFSKLSTDEAAKALQTLATDDSSLEFAATVVDRLRYDEDSEPTDDPEMTEWREAIRAQMSDLIGSRLEELSS